MIKRRGFLKIGMFTVVGATAVAALSQFKGLFSGLALTPVAQPSLKLVQSEQETLIAFVDLLVPSDDQSPGALDLGVHQQILDRIGADRFFRNIVKNGLLWLDQQARRFDRETFLLLSEAERLALVADAQTVSDASGASLFFQRMRSEVFHFYYADPGAWQPLCYSGPPQPLGYMDYSKSPEQCD